VPWRLEKINRLIKEEIAKIILRELEFGSILVTVTKVEVSSNLEQAVVWVSIFPSSENKLVFQILNKNIYHLQQVLNKKLKIKPVPKIKFEEDQTIQEMDRIDRLLKKK